MPHRTKDSALELSTLEAMALELANRIRAVVHPRLGVADSRAFTGTAIGGDATLDIDRDAEDVVAAFLEEEGNLAVFTEDHGLVTRGDPQAVLVVDPVDGTRPAAAGFESCCVSIAATRVIDSPVIDDIEVGVVRELKWDRTFWAARGNGLHIMGPAGELEEVRLSETKDKSALFWAGGFRGRPFLPVAASVAELADECSLRGSVFDLGSASFIMTRILTGQLDAYVDPALRLLDEYPGLEPEFLKTGGGYVLCNSPYDVAASILLFEEAGAEVTDCNGLDLGNRPILGSDREHQMSILAAASPELHSILLDVVDRGVERVGELWPELRRAKLS